MEKKKKGEGDRMRKESIFFKQKTAYEIGTGDWSSDVCSSDLLNSLFIPPVSSNSKVESAYSTSFDFTVLSFMILVSCCQHSC